MKNNNLQKKLHIMK